MGKRCFYCNRISTDNCEFCGKPICDWHSYANWTMTKDKRWCLTVRGGKWCEENPND